jgi:hypothetical protein
MNPNKDDDVDFIFLQTTTSLNAESDWDGVTQTIKKDVRKVADKTDEVKKEIEAVKAEVKSEIKAVKSEIAGVKAEMKSEISEVKDLLKQLLEKK